MRSSFVLLWCGAGAAGFVHRADLFECDGDPGWSQFKQRLRGAVKRNFSLDTELLGAAGLLVSSFGGEEGMVIAAEDFYHALCSESASTHCLYGLVNALFVLAAGLHLSARQEGLGEGAQMAQEHLQTALQLLGRQHCLDFVESSDWPIRSHDLLANVNRSLRQAFDLAGVDVSESTRWPPIGSTFNGYSLVDMSKSLSHSVSCSPAIRLTAVGTHPTLTLEAVTMIRDFGFGGEHMEVARVMGTTLSP